MHRTHGGHGRRAGVCFLLATSLLVGAHAHALDAMEALSQMSLEELARVEVTSVSKSAQAVRSAPAAIYVITREEILRNGVLSVPEALRLAPNLQVAQLNSSGYAITARGFGDHREAQTQANKLLILVDGRSVYSPLFSGVFYDAIDVVMDDIDRIEVISGPGATLWGANAMNGVINIITRSAADTQGALIRAGVGNQETAVALRYGDAVGRGSYRIYAKGFERGSLEFDDGSSAGDRWKKAQAGLRTDWRATSQSITVQADGYQAKQNLFGLDDITLVGANTVARWQLSTERSQWIVQAYYDRVEREAPLGSAGFELDTYDVEIQHSIRVGDRHHVVWGAGKRFNDYEIENVGPLQFLPPHRTLESANVFAQDTISLGRSVAATIGVKLEDNPYSGWEALPDVRVSWAPSEETMLWAAASHAIRSPTPFDVDVAEYLGPTLFLAGNPRFRNEEVESYELGYRGQPTAAMTLSISAFYANYENLRSVEFGSPSPIPLRWDNQIYGSTYGVEAWANFQITSWWRLAPGFRSLHKRLRFSPGASELLGVSQAGNDPSSQASLKSSMNIGSAVTLDAYLRYVNELPNPALGDYYELSARLAWRISESLEASLTGFNLLDDRHLEYPSPTGEQIGRSAYAEVRFRY